MADNRDFLQPFQSGPDSRRNLKGRPKGSLNSKTVINKWLKVTHHRKEEMISHKELKVTLMDIIVLEQIKKACKGDTQAFNALLDRFEGKPMQKQELDTQITMNSFPPQINITSYTVDLPIAENEDDIE